MNIIFNVETFKFIVDDIENEYIEYMCILVTGYYSKERLISKRFPYAMDISELENKLCFNL